MNHNEPRVHSSAVRRVLCSNCGRFEETKNGSYVYSVDAGTFHQLEFRTRFRCRGKGSEHDVEAVSKVADGIRGDAFIVAREVGLDNLSDSNLDASGEDTTTGSWHRVAD